MTTTATTSIELSEHADASLRRRRRDELNQTASAGDTLEPSSTHAQDVIKLNIPRELSTRLEIRRSYRFAKTALMTMLSPSAHLLILPTGGTSPTPAPSYHTSSLIWCHGMYMPPSFSLHSGTAVVDDKARARLKDAPPRSKLGAVKYHTWDGRYWMHFSLRRSTTEGAASLWPVVDGAQAASAEMPKTADIRRTGGGRTYLMRGTESDGAPLLGDATGLIWAPRSRKAVNALDLPAVGYADGSSFAVTSRGGHLMLYRASEPDRPVAVWANTTAVYHLGDLLLLQDIQEGRGLEEVVWAAVGIVLAERASGRGLWPFWLAHE